MVYQLFQNYANIEKFQNQEEEELIEYYQENNEEVIEYQTIITKKLREVQEEVNKAINSGDYNTGDDVEVLLTELAASIKETISKIEGANQKNEDYLSNHTEEIEGIETEYNKLKKMGVFEQKESFTGNTKDDEVDDEGNDDEGNDDEEADDEGNDEEGSDSNENDNFVDTDDNSEVVEGFQGNNNNIIEYNTGMGKILSLDLLLRSVLYACLFFILAHPDTLKMVGKLLKGVSKANLLYVHMLVFAVVYYVLNLFI